MRNPYAYLNVKPPYCDICTHYHWKNLPHQGNDWQARVTSRVEAGDMTLEQARANGLETAPPFVASVAYVAGQAKELKETTPAQKHLLDFLKINPGAEQKTIRERIRQRWQDIRHALTELVEQGEVTRTGSGTSHDGYRYHARERN